MQISLAGFGGALAGLSLAQRGRCPFVPLRHCLAIGRRGNTRGWFPTQQASGMLSPCNGRGRVGGGHDNSNNDRDNDDRWIIPQSVNGAHGGRLHDWGGRRRGAVPWNGWLLVASH